MLYPADVLPTGPVAAWGTFGLTASYTGSLIGVTDQTGSFDEVAIGQVNGDLDTNRLDAVRGSGNYAQVGTLYDQIGSRHATGAIGNIPWINDQTIGNARALIFDGGDETMYGLRATSFPSVGPVNYSIVAVVAPIPSLLRRSVTHTLEYTTGSVLAIEDSGGGTVAKAYCSANASVGWGATDGTFDFVASETMPENAPVVLSIVSSAAGVKIWQNEHLASTLSYSAKSNTANKAYIGRTGASATPQNDCFNGRMAAVMPYNYTLTDFQRAYVAAAFYERLGLKPLSSRYDARGVTLISDSIGAGYKATGKYGFFDRLQAYFSEPIRWRSLAAPGMAIRDGGGYQPYGYMLGLFTPPLSYNIAQTLTKSVVIIFMGGNDFTQAGPPSAATVYAGIQTLVTNALAAGATTVIVCTILPGNFAYQSSIDALNVLIRATPTNYTVCDLAAVPELAYTVERYPDGGHPSDATHQVIASSAEPTVRTALGL